MSEPNTPPACERAIAQKTTQYDEWLDAAEKLRKSRAEVEGLAKYGDDSRDTIDGLTEENERLREALEEKP